MQRILPGSTLRLDDSIPAAAQTLMTALFAGGNLMLSQVANITGLEPYVIQNWVARGFLPPPVNKRYSRRQLSRILIINMLRSVLTLDGICRLLGYINGHLNDESDDIVDDSKLYMYLVALTGGAAEEVSAETVLADYEEPFAGARKRVEQVLDIMVTAYASSELKHKAETLIAGLDEK